MLEYQSNVTNVFPMPTQSGSHKLGSLKEITAEDITIILDVEPIEFDDEKVFNQWNFRILFEDGTYTRAAIWDYKGSQNVDRFSFWCDKEQYAEDVFRKIFFDHVENC